MANTIHLIRHGHHALLGRQLCGRMSGVALDELGHQQMQRLAEIIAPIPSVIQSSPQQRARDSAAILAVRFNLGVEIAPAVDEIDVGGWTALTFAELNTDPLWHQWNSARSTGAPPNGENIHTLERRVVQHLERVCESDAETIAIVSHAEPIRAALLHYTGASLDDFLSIDVDVASVSTLTMDATGIRVSRINQQVPA
jgi:probable phosphoglycerate mutase